jgi:hypothetical protein
VIVSDDHIFAAMAETTWKTGQIDLKAAVKKLVFAGR